MNISTNDRRVLWASSAVFLLIILLLFSIGIFYKNVDADNPLLAGFYHITNVIVAISSAILATTVTGFARLTLERSWGKSGRLVIQGTGGFVVFILVIWANPKNVMFNAAEKLFASLAADCKAAANPDNKIHPNGKELCEKFANRFPSRPEPWRYLAYWVHLNEGQDGFEKASLYYKKSLENYGVSVNLINKHSLKNLKISDVDRVLLSECLSGYIVARSDYAVNRFGRDLMDRVVATKELDAIMDAIGLEIDVIFNDETDPFIWGRILDAKAKILLYKFYFFEENNKNLLLSALSAYDTAIDKKPYYVLWLKYHRILTKMILASKFDLSSTEIYGELIDFIDVDLDNFINGRKNQIEISMLKGVLLDMAENRRKEQFRVSRPFGSLRFGGDIFAAFLQGDSELTRKLNNRISRL